MEFNAICQHVEANNQYMKNYDRNTESVQELGRK